MIYEFPRFNFRSYQQETSYKNQSHGGQKGGTDFESTTPGGAFESPNKYNRSSRPISPSEHMRPLLSMGCTSKDDGRKIIVPLIQLKSSFSKSVA
jgi:hypothetical protein